MLVCLKSSVTSETPVTPEGADPSEGGGLLPGALRHFPLVFRSIKLLAVTTLRIEGHMVVTSQP